VPYRVIASPHFSAALNVQRTCHGDRVVSTPADLGLLRFCEILNGSLTITLFDYRVGFDPLEFITEIHGELEQ
jgi:hypothetical protein